MEKIKWKHFWFFRFWIVRDYCRYHWPNVDEHAYVYICVQVIGNFVIVIDVLLYLIHKVQGYKNHFRNLVFVKHSKFSAGWSIHWMKNKNIPNILPTPPWSTCAKCCKIHDISIELIEVMCAYFPHKKPNGDHWLMVIFLEIISHFFDSWNKFYEAMAINKINNPVIELHSTAKLYS